MTIEPGDYVRSYHFESRDEAGPRACYVEGMVEAITSHPDSPCDSYKIRVEREVFGGEELKEDVFRYVYPPVNGTRTLMGRVTDGVVKVERPEMSGEGEALDLYGRIIGKALNHGINSDLDHEVGDLQDVVWCLLKMLTPDQIAAVPEKLREREIEGWCEADQ